MNLNFQKKILLRFSTLNLFRLFYFVLHFAPQREDYRDDSSVHRCRCACTLFILQIQVQLLGKKEDWWPSTTSNIWKFIRLCCHEEKTFRWNLPRNLQVSLLSICDNNFSLSSYPTARYVGFYKIGEPALLIRDLEVVQDILVTKFSTFNKNDFSVDPEVNEPCHFYHILNLISLLVRSTHGCQSVYCSWWRLENISKSTISTFHCWTNPHCHSIHQWCHKDPHGVHRRWTRVSIDGVQHERCQKFFFVIKLKFGI